MISKRFKLASHQRIVIMLDGIVSSEHLAKYTYLRLILGKTTGPSEQLMKLPLPFLEVGASHYGLMRWMVDCKYPIICYHHFIKTMTGKSNFLKFVYYRKRLRIIGHHHFWWNIVKSLVDQGLQISFRGIDDDRDLDVEIPIFKPNMETITIIIRRFGSICDIERALAHSGAKKILIDYRAYDPSIEDIKLQLQIYANFDYAFV